MYKQSYKFIRVNYAHIRCFLMIKMKWFLKQGSIQTTLLEQLFFVVGIRVVLKRTCNPTIITCLSLLSLLTYYHYLIMAVEPLSTTELYPHFLLGGSICKRDEKGNVSKNMGGKGIPDMSCPQELIYLTIQIALLISLAQTYFCQ